jgi:hypothetical protein
LISNSNSNSIRNADSQPQQLAMSSTTAMSAMSALAQPQPRPQPQPQWRFVTLVEVLMRGSDVDVTLCPEDELTADDARLLEDIHHSRVADMTADQIRHFNRLMRRMLHGSVQADAPLPPHVAVTRVCRLFDKGDST